MVPQEMSEIMAPGAAINRTTSGASQRSAVYQWTKQRGQIIAFGMVNMELFNYKI